MLSTSSKLRSCLTAYGKMKTLSLLQIRSVNNFRLVAYQLLSTITDKLLETLNFLEEISSGDPPSPPSIIKMLEADENVTDECTIMCFSMSQHSKRGRGAFSSDR